jgi:predicted nucleic acid-binding Zn ribbon protein
MSDPALQVCPKELCGLKKKWGKGKVRRAISAGAGLIFKGSGFYITDYRSEKYKEAAKQESSKESGKETTTPAAAGDKKSTDAGASKSGSDSKESKGTKAESKPKPAKSE